MSKIHPPLPMTPQESRKLLLKFNSSFRRHLDREYPEIMSENRRLVPQHLQSILDNPLIGGSRKPCNHFDGHVESLSQLRQLMKRPMDHFKDEVAAGTATVESAKLCLIAQLQLARASSDKPLSLRSSGAAAIVLEWMCSLQATRLELPALDTRLVDLLGEVLSAEGNPNMLWYWIKQLNEKSRNELSKPKRQWNYVTQTFIIRSFLSNEIKNAGLSSAVDVFIRGALEISSWSKGSIDIVNHILRRPGRFLMLEILNRASLVPTLQLNAFIGIIPVWSPTPQVHQILLDIHRPQCSNIGAALKFLAELDVDDIVRLGNRFPQTYQRRDLVRLSLKVAELLLSSGSEQELRWVMEFLRTNFAAEICSPDQVRRRQRNTTSREQQQQSAEKSCLHLLNSLAVH